MIVVAGGTGFLGKNMCRRLDYMGIEYESFSRSTGIDICNYNSLVEYLKDNNASIVINCAALSGGILYNKTDQVGIFNGNMTIGTNLLRACSELGAKLINIMPNCVYPSCKSLYRETEWLDGDVHDSVRVIGASRRATWQLAKAYHHQHGVNSIHLILPNMYGPYDHFDPIRSHAMGALISKVVDAKLSGTSEIQFWGTGKPIREWLYVDDAVEGIIKAMDIYDDIEVMNIGCGYGISTMDMAHMIKKIVGWDGYFIMDLSKPDGAASKVMDMSKMKSILNWEPTTILEDGIKETVGYYLSNVEDINDHD